jgi:adenylate cyclase
MAITTMIQMKLKLHSTISILFVAIALPVMLIFIGVSYTANIKLIDTYTERFIQKSLNDNINNVTRLLNPLVSTARSAAALMRDKPDYFRDARSVDYLYEIVASNDAVYSAYAAFEDGSFRQVRRSVKGAPVLGKEVLPTVQLVDRFIDGSKGSKAVDSYRFHSTWGAVVGKDSGVATYDPRVRSYYKDALAKKSVNVSNVYVFASSGELGITIAAPIYANNQTIGVFAIDITLNTLSKYLSDNRVTDNSVTIIADEAGGVVAHPSLEMAVVKKDSGLVQNNLYKMPDDRVLAALAERLRSGLPRFHFHAGSQNAEYIGVFFPFPKDFNKPWELLIIIPTNDLVGAIESTNRALLLFGLIALLLQVALIYRFSRSIARPMEQLAIDVANIQEFQFDKVVEVKSSVEEVRTLANSVYRLRRVLESFSSYVPRAMVRQLMSSGVGTQLGVESRFLTMFFTDIEGFSTLSESEPSQQLLPRVSEYFSNVTGAVEREKGTVDKYIGDAVMAFWGAPLRVDDHVYLACVAAVRAQRAMKASNAHWAAQKLAPLNVRIGIHCDSVLVGNVGSKERLSYTVMGDGVNVAARLEGMNKELGTWICVSHAVYRAAGERLWLRPIDTITVKGRKGELLVYELMAIKGADADVGGTAQEIDLCGATIDAFAIYSGGDLVGALAAYEDILQRYPADPVAVRMIAKCTPG